MRSRLALSAAVLAIGAGAGAVGAEAAVVSGSNLSQEGNPATCFPNPFEVLPPPASCTLAISSLPDDKREGSDHAAVDGVIVGWRIKTGANLESIKMRLRVVRGETGVGSGPTEQLPTAAGTYSYAARLPVRAGDAIGLDLIEVKAFPGAAIFSSSPGASMNLWSPPLADGETRSPLTYSTSIVLVNATIEPDADGDGFGDETQDGCASDRSAQGACPVPAAAVAPETILGKRPAGTIHARRITFRFNASVAGSTFRCKLDKKPFKACRSPKTYKGLAEGKHVFKVKAVGPTGLVDPTAAKRRFKVQL